MFLDSLRGEKAQSFIKLFRKFVIMTTLTVNINDKKTEKAVKAFFDALGLSYNEEEIAKTVEKRQTLKQYNADLEDGNKEIEQGNFISASQLKAEASKW